MKKGDDFEIVRWREEENKSFREIGRILGLSHVAVRKRYVKTAKQQASRLLTNANLLAASEIGQDEVKEENQPTAVTRSNGENTASRLLSNVMVQATSPAFIDEGSTPIMETQHAASQEVGINTGLLTIANNSLLTKVDLQAAPTNPTPEDSTIKAETISEVSQPTESTTSPARTSFTTPTQYLKKMGTPEWDYHIATPILLQEATRLKLFPYDPETKMFIGLNGQKIPEHISTSQKSASIVTKEEYLIHKATGRIVQKNARAYPKGELEPYTPPKFLRKMDGPNKGKIFPWTFYLAQRKDMMPFEGDPSNLPSNQVTSQRDEGK